MTLARQPDDSESHRFAMSIPNTPAGASLARKHVMGFIKHLSPDSATIAEFETVVGEALANAAEHGYRPGGTIRLEAVHTDGWIETTVSDDGSGFSRAPHDAERPEVLSPRGYGLFLVKTLTDAFEYRDGGTSIWFRKQL
jgi:anti-sigma regulatory factor (Ser/Thr protein kinase)